VDEGRLTAAKNSTIISSHCCNLRLFIPFQLRHQTLNALLEITVLGCVDERVDDAVAEHQHRDEVVVPTSKVDSKLAVVADSSYDMEWGEADDVSAAYHR